MDPYQDKPGSDYQHPEDPPNPEIPQQPAGINQPPGGSEYPPYQGPAMAGPEMFDPGYSPPPPPPKLPRAGTAFLAFLVFLGAQIVGSIVVVVIGVVHAASAGVDMQDADAINAFLQARIMQYMAYGMVPIMIGSGLAVLLVTRRMARDVMTIGEPDGIGWTACSPAQFLGGLVLGLGVAVGYLLLAATVFADYQPTSQGDLAKMATSGGMIAVLWGTVAVLCAPLIEEFLFRGVMLAGFTRSFGLPVAVVLCTLIFVSLHITELVHFWPGTFGVGGMAIVAIALRIKMKSLGPAIAVHLGYNGTLVALVALSYLPESVFK